MSDWNRQVGQSRLSAADTKVLHRRKVNNSNRNMGDDPVRQEDWKALYQESEGKRQALIRLAQKATSDYEELRARYAELRQDYSVLYERQQDTEDQLKRLRTVSEAVYKEYESLRTRYKVETGAMQDVMETASKWYKQNRALKRKSVAMEQKFKEIASGISVVEFREEENGSDEDSESDEVQVLNTQVKELQEVVVGLQTTLNQAKLEEFEAQEQMLQLSAELEKERKGREAAEKSLQDLENLKVKFTEVSRLVVEEVVSLQSQCQQEKGKADHLRTEADKLRRERNVLAHQSALLLSEVSLDSRFNKVLEEVEVLKRHLEEEKLRHCKTVDELQAKINELESTKEAATMKEKLELVTLELGSATQRYMKAEKRVIGLEQTVIMLESKVEELTKRANTSPPPPPAMPPPPPPPPPSNPVFDLVCLLGIRKKDQLHSRDVRARVNDKNQLMDNMIKEIKTGSVRLRSTGQSCKEPQKVSSETPDAVSEMRKILNNLRKVTHATPV